MVQKWRREPYLISTDRQLIDVELVHSFLQSSYWAKERSRERLVRSLDASLVFGLYREGAQVGFARVVTDFVVVAYLADVFVLPEHRGQGLGQWLVKCVMSHPELNRIRRWILGTRDAHGLYQKFGFQRAMSETMMARIDEAADRE